MFLVISSDVCLFSMSFAILRDYFQMMKCNVLSLVKQETMERMCIITYERKCSCQSTPLTEKCFHKSELIDLKRHMVSRKASSLAINV